MVVVADGHSRNYGFAATDDIPSGGLQVDHIAQ